MMADVFSSIHQHTCLPNILLSTPSAPPERSWPVSLTTNRAFRDWARIFTGDTTIAGAIPDRPLHHRHVTAINGPSYRNPDITGPLPLHDDRDEV